MSFLLSLILSRSVVLALSQLAGWTEWVKNDFRTAAGRPSLGGFEGFMGGFVGLGFFHVSLNISLLEIPFCKGHVVIHHHLQQG